MKVLNMENTGKAIKKYRLHKNLTQADLANKLSVSPSAIGMYEQGRRTPPVDILYNIASILEVDFLDLIPDIKKDYITEHNNELLIAIDTLKKELLKNSKKNSNNKINPRINTIVKHLNSDTFTNKDLEDIQQFINFVESRK